jgi:hypothetical protein
VSVDVLSFRKKTEDGTHTARVSVGQAKTQNITCTMKSVTDVEASHPAVTVTTQPVLIATERTSRMRTLVCVSIHGACSCSAE